LVGCLAPVDMSKVELGMTKDEVIRVLGTPNGYNEKGGTTYLYYNAYVEYESLYVKLVDGKVESFGRIRIVP